MSRLYYPSETDNPSSKFVKTNVKQKDKVRRIVNRKFIPFHFQIKTYYLFDAHYPMDNRLRRIIFLSREYGRFWTNNPSDFIRRILKTDHPSQVWKRPIYSTSIFFPLRWLRLGSGPLCGWKSWCLAVSLPYHLAFRHGYADDFHWICR